MYQMELAQQTLQQIIRRLIEGYQPQRIILFGSLAYGEPDEDSDIDLLVVKETTESPPERLTSSAINMLTRGICTARTSGSS